LHPCLFLSLAAREGSYWLAFLDTSHNTHDAAQALEDCDACLAHEPDYVKAHFRRGLALVQLARFGASSTK
jgi:hypothetical protein